MALDYYGEEVVMKVCIIENIYAPYDRGGAEQVVAKTIQGLLGNGHEVVLLTASPKGYEFQEEAGLKIYRMRPKNLYFYTDAHKYHPVVRLLWHVIGMYNISTASWVKKKLQEIQPTVVHTHNLMGMSFLIPSIINKLGLRHVHTVHDVQLVEPSAMIMKPQEDTFRYSGPHTKVYSFFMKRLMGSPDVVISPSNFLIGFYKKRGFFPESETMVLRNPVTFDLPTPPRKRSAQEEGLCHFLYVGQIAHHKGVLLLLDAFLKISKQYSNVRLHIAGNGPQLEEVKENIGDNKAVIAYGRLAHDKLAELFEQSDVTVVPSLCYENSPTVIFESFYFGLPVVASHIEGIAELIDEKENGLTFKAGDLEELQKQLIWCLTHKEELQEMSGKTGGSLRGLSLENYIKKLEGSYRK